MLFQGKLDFFFPCFSNNLKILGLDHPIPALGRFLLHFSWKIWGISGGIRGWEFQGVEETIPNQLECGRNVRKSLFLCWKHFHPGFEVLEPIPGCKEWGLEHETGGKVPKNWEFGSSQISQVCQLCQQSPRLFSNHAAQLHTLLVSSLR